MVKMFFWVKYGHQNNKFKQLNLIQSNQKFSNKLIVKYLLALKDGTNFKSQNQYTLNGMNNQLIFMIHHSLNQLKNNYQNFKE